MCVLCVFPPSPFLFLFSSFLAGLWVLQSAGSPVIRSRTVKVLGPGPCGLAWRCGICSRAFPFREGPEAHGHPAPFFSFLLSPFPFFPFFLYFFSFFCCGFVFVLFRACSFLCPVLLLKNGVTRHARHESLATNPTTFTSTLRGPTPAFRGGRLKCQSVHVFWPCRRHSRLVCFVELSGRST